MTTPILIHPLHAHKNKAGWMTFHCRVVLKCRIGSCDFSTCFLCQGTGEMACHGLRISKEEPCGLSGRVAEFDVVAGLDKNHRWFALLNFTTGCWKGRETYVSAVCKCNFDTSILNECTSNSKPWFWVVLENGCFDKVESLYLKWH